MYNADVSVFDLGSVRHFFLFLLSVGCLNVFCLA